MSRKIPYAWALVCELLSKDVAGGIQVDKSEADYKSSHDEPAAYLTPFIFIWVQ